MRSRKRAARDPLPVRASILAVVPADAAAATAGYATVRPVGRGLRQARLLADRNAGAGPAPRAATCCRCCSRPRRTAKGMSDRQVHDEALTLFLAGHETTSQRAHVDLVVAVRDTPRPRRGSTRSCDQRARGRGRRPPTDLPRLPFTTAVLSESMRLRAARLGHRASGGCRPRPRGGPVARRARCRRVAVAPASRRTRLVASAERVPSRTLAPAGRGPSSSRLHAVRGRATHVHRRRVRVDGGWRWSSRPLARGWRFTPGALRSCRAATGGHPAPATRDADASPASRRSMSSRYSARRRNVSRSSSLSESTNWSR